MTARDRDRAVQVRLERAGCGIVSLDDANTLRRAEMTLQRWGEACCGTSNDYASWIIERDETGVPYRVMYPHRALNGHNRITRIPDRERGALARVKAVCERYGLHWYHQTDPRGCALYVSREPLTDSDYTRGIAINA